MPKMDAVPEYEAQEIEREIKKELAGAGSNVSDAVRRINEMFGTNDTPQTVTRQLKQGILPHWKLRRIAAALDYELVWKKKEPQQ
ncbi:hypothetical protein [Sporomusa sphaeroides]|uniref:Uncharacterized protein n=1 Tax=Sporomusa sphaeroides DSM 2875 TaxID=1337886 RepID=A0ABM9W017_9FIRM|nr:hypothetical protein [Sporomusa sphaeroides]OLS56344.1 hypothetical protein SPSPH_27370 [Sporomusa sphaeroides DSM 2875]CVK18439.1 hypothetical protein SSPH_01077 [Sporomusa sphaeroides DSM 2875]